MQDQFEELLSNYFQQPIYEIETVPFGLTNVTRIVKINGENYILRIYNLHTKHIESIELESKITTFLSQGSLSFQVPVFIPTRTGDRFVRLSDGSLGAVVSYLDGSIHHISNIEDAAEIGRVAGEITHALRQCDINQLNYSGISFSDMYRLHPLANRQAIAAFMENPSFHIPESSLDFYHEMVVSIDMNACKLKELPVQLVHHDLLIFNLLSQNNRICGVLDFDFLSLDTSFMEFTICLNHILQMTDGSMEMAEAFVKSYSVYRKHTLLELEQLQNLTQVYHLAVLHIYVGQHNAGVDIEQNFNYILKQFITRNEWLNKHRIEVQQMLVYYLVE
ncbi:phosphotransferase enzyme family protein [Paenibacillus planticolens]|uniref:Phosphotransferase n=1 Tax=Paenibacillus planticolens TaxID=2654976 RepID=A0ABX1ZU27_9BACL|nr:phosphotransferase [Paenibacillus planticolens]NOV02145.1 phosphotransferase [Paenibacillus planticolens]